MCFKVIPKVLKFVSKSMKRKDVKNVLKMLSIDDEAELMMEKVEELKELYNKKLKKTMDKLYLMTPEERMEFVENYLKKKLSVMGIDIEEIEIAIEKGIKMVSNFDLSEFWNKIDEVERISHLKDEAMLIKGVESAKNILQLNDNYLQHKKDYRTAIEKALTENRDKMDKITIDNIKREAVEEYKEMLKRNKIGGKNKMVTSQRKNIIKK